MTVKTETELKDDFADGQFRTVSAEKIRDFIDSRFGVGGEMIGNGQEALLTGAWENYSWFTEQRSTKGVTPTLASGIYTVDPGGDGAYITDINLTFKATIAMSIKINVTHKGVLSQYETEKELVADIPISAVIFGGGNFAAGDEIGVAVNGSQATTPGQLVIADAQFRVVRQ